MSEVRDTPFRPDEIESVRILRLRAGDEIVLTVSRAVGEFAIDSIRKAAEERWPGHRVTILGEGIDIQVVRS